MSSTEYLNAQAGEAGRMIGHALAEIGAARQILARLADDEGTDVTDERWQEIDRLLNFTGRIGYAAEVFALRRACAVIAGDAPGAVLGELNYDEPAADPEVARIRRNMDLLAGPEEDL